MVSTVGAKKPSRFHLIACLISSTRLRLCLFRRSKRTGKGLKSGLWTPCYPRKLNPRLAATVITLRKRMLPKYNKNTGVRQAQRIPVFRYLYFLKAVYKQSQLRLKASLISFIFLPAYCWHRMTSLCSPPIAWQHSPKHVWLCG